MKPQSIRKIRIEYTGRIPPTEITVDAEVQSCYIRLQIGKVTRTVEHAQGVMVDLDESGSIVGIELTAPVGMVDFREVGEKYISPADAVMHEKLETAVRHAVAV